MKRPMKRKRHRPEELLAKLRQAHEAPQRVMYSLQGTVRARCTHCAARRPRVLRLEGVSKNFFPGTPGEVLSLIHI